MRRLPILILMVALSLGSLMPAGVRPVAAGARLCFPETGTCADNAFAQGCCPPSARCRAAVCSSTATLLR